MRKPRFLATLRFVILLTLTDMALSVLPAAADADAAAASALVVHLLARKLRLLCVHRRLDDVRVLRQDNHLRLLP